MSEVSLKRCVCLAGRLAGRLAVSVYVFVCVNMCLCLFPVNVSASVFHECVCVSVYFMDVSVCII